MTGQSMPIAPGAHIVVRDAVWRVLQVNPTSTGKKAWSVVGISEIVRDQEAIFLEEYEPSVSVLDPAKTGLELDTSPGHRASLLYMESLLREVPPTTAELHVGHRAAMDVMDFQLDPARQALEQLRPRILIADAVGLGKTLEAGILMSELIRRGRGRRILVATVKSMLTQFQKEMWCRFSIPLVRLDSVGLQRIREHIPTNHNPFYYYDRAIISIDTLKQNNAFRTHVEQAWWDIIVIDEAHNVAVRGGGRSQRARIAEVLAERSDALILLSATPHDGKARSFASLMNMLDPTAIANPDDYGPKEIEGLFVRRFKKDVQDQIGKAFPERVIARAHGEATPQEEAAFDALTTLRFSRIDQRAHGGMLFRTTLEKALFSSPAACLQTIRERIGRLRKDDAPEGAADDILALEEFALAVEKVGPASFSKYRKLVKILSDGEGDFRWSARKGDERLVIFSERIETLRFLEKHLRKDLGLSEAQVALLHGGLPDVKQQEIVEEFGKGQSKIRLLLASDVAAEGLNLHYLCHQLIHFDIPWSLMIFQQRNGRIDRYGQVETPRILYLLTQTANPDIRGDLRILDLLIERDEQARRNIGDPSALMGVYDVDEEERFTARAIEEGLSAEAFDEKLGRGEKLDPFEQLLRGAPPAPARAGPPRDPLSLFRDDFAYAREGLEWLKQQEGIESEVRVNERVIEIRMPADTEEARRRRAPAADLRRRFRQLPVEVLPEDLVVVLTPDQTRMQKAMEEARREESAWPRLHYLWPLSPVVGWINDKAKGAFGRHTAPVITLVEGMGPTDATVVVSGLIPNRRGQPLVHRWFAANFAGGNLKHLETFEAFAERVRFGRRPLPNRPAPVDAQALSRLVGIAVDRVRDRMLEVRREEEKRINAKLQQELDRLEALRGRQLAQLEFRFAERAGGTTEKGREARRVNRVFDRYLEWVEDSMTTEPVPFLQVIAVLRPEGGYGTIV